MINFDEFDQYVKSRSEVRSFISPARLITHQEIVGIRSIIKKYKSSEVLKCISSNNQFSDKFYAETKCDQCDALTKERLSKTQLEKYINGVPFQNFEGKWNNKNYVCASCEWKNQRKEEETYKKDLEIRKVKFQENTSYYIDNYLNPNRKWNKETSAKQRIDLIKHANVNWKDISDHIKGMKYRDFLATPYWKTIAAHTRYKAGYRCQLCNHGDYLSTHHRNYNIHGQEHAHMNELIVLCNNCHHKFHGIKKNAAHPESRNVSDKIYVISFGLIFFLIVYFIHSHLPLFKLSR